MRIRFVRADADAGTATLAVKTGTLPESTITVKRGGKFSSTGFVSATTTPDIVVADLDFNAAPVITLRRLKFKATLRIPLGGTFDGTFPTVNTFAAGPLKQEITSGFLAARAALACGPLALKAESAPPLTIDETLLNP